MRKRIITGLLFCLELALSACGSNEWKKIAHQNVDNARKIVDLAAVILQIPPKSVTNYAENALQLFSLYEQTDFEIDNQLIMLQNIPIDKKAEEKKKARELINNYAIEKGFQNFSNALEIVRDVAILAVEDAIPDVIE